MPAETPEQTTSTCGEQEPLYKVGDRVVFSLGSMEYEGVIISKCKYWSEGDWVVDLEDDQIPINVDEHELRHAEPPTLPPAPEVFFEVGDRVLWQTTLDGEPSSGYTAIISRRGDCTIDGGHWFIAVTGIQAPICVREETLVLLDDVFMEGDVVTWTVERPDSDNIVLTGIIERPSTLLENGWVINRGAVIQSVPAHELSLADMSEENTVTRRSEKRQQRRKEKWEKRQRQSLQWNQQQGLQGRNGGVALPGVSSSYKTNKKHEKKKSWTWKRCPPTAVQEIAHDLFGDEDTYHTAKED